LLILASLAGGPKHGYAMMEDIEAMAGVRLGPGTLYGALARMEQRGWIRPVASQDRRQPYYITGAGRAHLEEELASLDRVLRTAMRSKLPPRIFNRQDKMGFPVPLHEWLSTPGPVRDYVRDVFSSQAARSRELIDNTRVLEKLDWESRFGRQAWGLLSLELWQRSFHDRAAAFRRKLATPAEEVTL
jgi:DNA-binding PadR family transcriptional regulator